MLPNSQRLNLKKDFKWVASGKKLETNLLKLFIKYGDNSIPKVGIAVSSKNFNRANQRNRAKRLVSTAFQSLYRSLPNDINIVALPKPGVIKVKSDELTAELRRLLENEKIIR